MSKKLVVSLFAGAMLLSAGAAFAGPGIVSGNCANCHTMHNSQNGSGANGTNTANDQLLVRNGCVGCHATGNGNGADGLDASAPFAPQVDDAANTLNGGYFANTGALNAAQAAVQHNVADLGNDGDTNILGTGATVQPGGTTTPGLGNTTAAALTCQGCHTQAGHHNVAAGVYRMLTGTNTSTRNLNYGVGGAGDSRSATAYDATAMNDFCANCHGTFHTAQAGSAAGLWARHPTDIQVATTAGPSIVALNAATDVDTVVVGSDGATTDILMCISCHVPHGSANDDLLAFAYDATTNAAGDGTADTGCETCHNYGGSGM